MATGSVLARWRLAIALLALLLLKLVLVSHHEVVVRGYDDGGFARMGAAGYWGEPFGSEGFARQPVYPVLVNWCSRAGLPQRVVIEVAWALACLVLARGLRACGVRPGLALAAGALSLFHPPTIGGFDRLLQDNLYGPLVVAFTASIAAAVAVRLRGAAWRWGLLGGVTGALAANTRPESILLYGTIGVAGVLAVALWRLGGRDGSMLRTRLAAAVLAPALLMQALTIGLAQANRAHFGVAVTTEFMLPGLKGLYRALLSIPPDPTAPGGGRDPRLPITRDVRERAYAASPTFATLRPWLDGEHRLREFARACERRTGVQGEYGGWTVWALRLAAWRSRGEDRWKSAADVNAFYAQAAAEIRAAQRRGELASRAVPIAYVPPLWGEIIARLPASVAECWRLAVPGAFQREYSDPRAIRHRRDFDRAARRRAEPRAIADRDEEALARLDGSSWWYTRRRVAQLDAVKSGLAATYRAVVPAALVVGLAGLLAGAVSAAAGAARRGGRMRVRATDPGPWIAAAVIGTALGARILLVAVMDVTGLPVLERYLLPCGPWMIALGVLGLQVGAAGRLDFEPRLKGRRTEQAEGRDDDTDHGTAIAGEGGDSARPV